MKLWVSAIFDEAGRFSTFSLPSFVRTTRRERPVTSATASVPNRQIS